MADSNLFQFYSRVPKAWQEEPAEQEPEGLGDENPFSPHSKERIDPVRKQVVAKVREVVQRLGGEVADDQWHTYDRWPYFQHVTADLMKEGYYDRLENLQGEQNTYYVGAIMNFELVESCIAYSKQLVHKHFTIS